MIEAAEVVPEEETAAPHRTGMLPTLAQRKANEAASRTDRSSLKVFGRKDDA